MHENRVFSKKHDFHAFRELKSHGGFVVSKNYFPKSCFCFMRQRFVRKKLLFMRSGTDTRAVFSISENIYFLCFQNLFTANRFKKQF